MKKRQLLAGSFLVVALLSGCGGSSSPSESDTADSESTKLEQYGDCLFRYADGQYTSEQIENICGPILD